MLDLQNGDELQAALRILLDILMTGLEPPLPQVLADNSDFQRLGAGQTPQDRSPSPPRDLKAAERGVRGRLGEALAQRPCRFQDG